MNCLRCGATLTDAPFCTGCGEDVAVYKKIIHLSNYLYNDGLAKAQVRDLSGAGISLRQCLKLNKSHIQARNLLGLVYFAQGEVVSALSEWIISKNIKGDKNVANMYIDAVQSNQSKLNLLNQTVRKYNIALEYCRQDSDDLAAIQLRKIIGMHPNMLKAQQLLALIYMKNQEYDKAARCLNKALEIDAANTITLRLLHETDVSTGKVPSEPKKKKKPEQITYKNDNELIIQPPVRKDFSALTTVMHILLGIVVGVAVMWFLIIPNLDTIQNSDANKQVVELSRQVDEKLEQIERLEKEIEGYQGQVNDAEDKVNQSEAKASSYDGIIAVAKAYAAPDRDDMAVYGQLEAIDENTLEGEARELYDTMVASLKETVISTVHAEAERDRKNGRHEEAIQKYLQVYAVDPAYDDYNVVYYLARSYEKLQDVENALRFYQEVIDNLDGGTTRAKNAKKYIENNTATE